MEDFNAVLPRIVDEFSAKGFQVKFIGILAHRAGRGKEGKRERERRRRCGRGERGETVGFLLFYILLILF